MICVTIGRGRHSSLAEEWKAAAEAGVELVELRLDCLRRDPDLKRILKDRPTPAVFTIRRGVDGGLWRGNEDRRQQLLREAVALGVDYVDLEMDIAPKIRRFGKTKRIVSYHNFNEVPGDLEEIYAFALQKFRRRDEMLLLCAASERNNRWMLEEKQDVLRNGAGDSIARNVTLQLERFAVTESAEGHRP